MTRDDVAIASTWRLPWAPIEQAQHPCCCSPCWVCGLWLCGCGCGCDCQLQSSLMPLGVSGIFLLILVAFDFIKENYSCCPGGWLSWPSACLSVYLLFLVCSVADCSLWGLFEHVKMGQYMAVAVALALLGDSWWYQEMLM